MFLREYTNGLKKLEYTKPYEIQKTLEKNNAFLHPLFNIKDTQIFFCSNSCRVYVVDNEALECVATKYLAKNRVKKIEINHKLEYFAPLITSRCNMNCKYCLGYGGIKAGKNADFDNVKIAIDFVKTQRSRPVVEFIAVGEAFLNYPLLKKVLDYMDVVLRPKLIKISSNGTGDPKHYIEILDKFNVFQISFDGVPEIQNMQRPMRSGRASSTMVVKTIKELVKNNKNFTIKMTVTKSYCGKEEKIVKYMKALGVKSLSMSVVGALGYGKMFEESRIAKENMKAISSELKIKELCDLTGIDCKVLVASYLGSEKAHYCHLGNNFIVGVDGKIFACGVISEEEDNCLHGIKDELMIGFIDKKEQKVKLFWNKIKKFHNYPNTVKECLTCDFKLCWGGCPLRNLIDTGSIEKVSKESCTARKQETIEYIKYLVMKDYLKLVPRLETAGNKLYLRGFSAKLLLSKETTEKGENFIIKFDPKKDDLYKLLDVIIKTHKRTRSGLGLFLLSPPCNTNLNAREFILLKDFLYTLKDSNILFLMTKPIKFIDVDHQEIEKFYENFNVPKICYECLELFKVEKDRIVLCNGTIGPKFADVVSREEIYSLLSSEAAHT